MAVKNISHFYSEVPFAAAALLEHRLVPPPLSNRHAGQRASGEKLSLNELAYRRLKETLVTLVYKPGDYINLAKVMEAHGLGRTPASQAVHRLSMEGLLHIIPRKGIMVAPLSINDAFELIDVRTVNERLCLQLATPRITDTEIGELRALVRGFDNAAARRDTMEVMNTDLQFHETLAAASGNSLLCEILRVLHARAQRFWAISLSVEGHLDEVSKEHTAIVDALARRDVAAAVAAVETHIRSFRSALVNAPR